MLFRDIKATCRRRIHPDILFLFSLLILFLIFHVLAGHSHLNMLVCILDILHKFLV